MKGGASAKMTPQSTKQFQGGRNIFRETAVTIASNPVVIFLFAFLALVQAAALTVLFLSHSAPFNALLGPVIRRFWGERFLHYPDNFLLLPKLFAHAETVVVTLVGLVITGAAIQLVASARSQEYASTIVKAFSQSFRRYAGMLLVWLVIFFSLRHGARAAFDALPNVGLVPHFAALFVIFLASQILTAFLFPALFLSGKKYWAALADGVNLAFKNLPALTMLLIVPVAVTVALSFVKTLSPMISKNHPDMVLVILYLSILVTTAVDIFITSATAILYLKVRSSK